MLKVKGRAKLALTTVSGATSEQLVYIIEGDYIEPLLGLEASLELGVLEIHPEGRRQDNDTTTPVYQIKEPNNIPQSVVDIINNHQSVFHGIGKFKPKLTLILMKMSSQWSKRKDQFRSHTETKCPII